MNMTKNLNNNDVLKSQTKTYIAAISDGELLDKLEYLKTNLVLLECRLKSCSPHEALKIREQICNLKVVILETIVLLEELGYDCRNSRSFI